MDGENECEPEEIESLLRDPAITIDTALVWPSLTAIPTQRVTGLSTDWCRHAAAIPPSDQVYRCGTEAVTSTAHAVSASFSVTTRANKLPATLLRTLEGRVCAWSHGMERRYGFPASQAIGVTSQQLLRTVSRQTFDESNCELLDQQTWSGGLIHRRSDGRPIATASSWHLHPKSNGAAPLVTEVHTDIIATGSEAGAAIADIVAALSHEMLEALTALGLYTMASRRALRAAWPDCVLAGQALTRAMGQTHRTIETVRLMRELGQQLLERPCSTSDIEHSVHAHSQAMTRET
jgi:PAS domain-containing protein